MPDTVVAASFEYDARSSVYLRRSVNGGSAIGGYVRGDADQSMRHLRDVIAPAELRAGLNTLFFQADDYGISRLPTNVGITFWTRDSNAGLVPTFVEAMSAVGPLVDTGAVVSPANWSPPSLGAKPTGLDIIYPLRGEYFGDRALIRGQAAEGAQVYVDGTLVRQSKGGFEAIVDRRGASLNYIDVVAVAPDGVETRRRVALNRALPDGDLSRPQAVAVVLSPTTPTASALGAELAIGPSADEPIEVGVTCLRDVDAPDINILQNGDGECAAYQFDQASAASLTVRLPVIVDRLPEGFDPLDTRAVRYEASTQAWSIVPDSFVDIANKQTVMTLHEQSSTVTSGILPAPRAEGSEPLAHNKEDMADLSNLDPLSGKVTVAAPEPNPYGSANLTFPIMLRPVRGANQPRFSLTYNSLRDNGLAGDGWTLEVPTISVETKWGVPEYADTLETETYLFQGEELVAFDQSGKEVPAAYRNNFTTNPISRTGITTFRLRRDNLFATFTRLGSSPRDYHWRIDYKDGNVEYYGGLTGGADENAVRKAETIRGPAIFEWGLVRAEDPNGNYISYAWKKPTPGACSPAPCVTSLVPSEIVYNQHPSVDEKASPPDKHAAGLTTVTFEWTAGRVDSTINARTGIAVVQSDRLSRIVVSYLSGSKTYATYDLDYIEPAPEGMYKSLLKAVRVTVPDAPDCPDPCNKQEVIFAYHRDRNTFESSGGADPKLADGMDLEGVGLLKEVTKNPLLGSFSLLGTNVTSDVGGGFYLGIAPDPNKAPSAGAKVGFVSKETETRSVVADVTGDGLADIVVDVQGRLHACAGVRDETSGVVSYPDSLEKCLNVDFIGAGKPDLSRETGNTFSISGEFHALPRLMFGGGYSKSRSSQSTYMADIDGNGLVDIVSGGVALFNQGLSAGRLVFTRSTRFVNQPGKAVESGAEPAAFAALQEFYKTQRDTAAEDQKLFNATDVVQSWKAPYDGVVGISGTIYSVVNGPKEDEQTTIVVARSGPGSAQPIVCAESDVLRPLLDIRWNDTLSCSSALNAADLARVTLLKSVLGASAPLFVPVRKGEVLYFRTNGGSEAKTNPGLSEILIDYAIRPVPWWQQRPPRPHSWLLGNLMRALFLAFPGSTTDYAWASIFAEHGKWDHAKLSLCRTPGRIPALPLPPRCDVYGRSPNSFSLSEDMVFSAVSTGDAIVDTGKFQLGAVDDSQFSGKLRYPVGRQPVQITLLSILAPQGGSTKTSKTAKDQAWSDLRRDFIDDATALVATNDWDEEFTTVLPAHCDAEGKAPQLLPPIPNLRVTCDGNWVFAEFDRVPLTLCGATCGYKKRLRLELQPQFGIRAKQPQPEVIAAFGSNARALAYEDLFWMEAPRLTYKAMGAVPDDVADLGGAATEPFDPAKRAFVDDDSQKLMLEPRTVTAFLPAIVRGRYADVINADLIGRRNGAESYQAIEIRKERAYLTGNARFDDPVIDADGYRLPLPNLKQASQPGEPAKPDKLLSEVCAGKDETTGETVCEYRIAHVFFSDDPKVIEVAAAAFAFDVTVFVDGKVMTLDYRGTVPHFACGKYPKTDYPNEHLDRPADCGLVDPTLAVPDSRTPARNVGMQFILNDGNRVRGRDLIFSFKAKPGSILQVKAAVRPLWDGYKQDFASVDEKGCLDDPVLPREIFVLLDQDTLKGGHCRRWFGLRSSELRLGVEGGLGLADKAIKRRDFARLFVPIEFAEEHYKILPNAASAFQVASPTGNLREIDGMPRVVTDHRGWARFAHTWPSAPPAYDLVQYPRRKGQATVDKEMGDDLARECSGLVGQCETKANTTKSDERAGMSFPLTAIYWAEDLGAIYKEGREGKPKPDLSAATVGGFEPARLITDKPCGGLGIKVAECFLGPDSDVWVSLMRTPDRLWLGQSTGYLGPDNIVAVVPRPESVVFADPLAVVVAGDGLGKIIPNLPLPSLYSDSTSLTARVAVVSNVSSSSTSGALYLDMNGDGYPDPLVGGTVYYSGPTGIPREQWLLTTRGKEAGYDERTGKARQLDLSVSIGDGGPVNAEANAPADASGNLGQTTGAGNANGAGTNGAQVTAIGKSNPDASFGLGMSLDATLGASYTPTDLMDVNGDGLPDQVQLDQPSFIPIGPQRPGNMRVKLNYGYSYATEWLTWSLPRLPASVNAGGGLGLTLGYNDGNAGWSGGVALSRSFSSSRESLIDINGDGMVDLVAPDGTGYAVYFNNGSGFTPDAKQLRLDTSDGWSYRDVAASEASAVDAGVTVAPAYPCFIFCFIISNPGARVAKSAGRQIVAMQDLDGDGLVDISSTGGFYKGMKGDLPNLGFFGATQGTTVMANPLGKRNKLLSITNPSGSVITLDYKLFGNTAENPKGIWGLSQIKVDDGYRPTDADDGADLLVRTVDYRRGNYDRWERAFLGFAEVAVTDGGEDCALGACAEYTALRTATRCFHNDSIYVQGLLRREAISPAGAGVDCDQTPDHRTVASEFFARDYVYDLWSIDKTSDFAAFTMDCLKPSSLPDDRRDDRCATEVAGKLGNRIAALHKSIWTGDPNRRQMPRLVAVRNSVIEKGNVADAVRSMVVYDYDTSGNVTSLLDLGQVERDAWSEKDTLDEYRTDLVYDKANAAIRDRIKTISIQKELAVGWHQDRVLRHRQAVYDARGNLQTVCQYLEVTAVLATERDIALCDAIAKEWPTTQHWGEFRRLLARAGIGPMDIAVDRRLDQDVFGNAKLLVSPFNVDGERIETRVCFDDDPFALIATRTRQFRLAVDASGIPSKADTCEDQAPPSGEVLADFNWASSIDTHLGVVNTAVDINNNALGYVHDNWGRLRGVLSDWGAPNADDPRVDAGINATPDEKARFERVSGWCKLVQGLALPGDDDRKRLCSVMLTVDYRSLADDDEHQPGLLAAVGRRYVLEDLYAGGTSQDDKSALWQAVIADGTGKLVQSNQEAQVCVGRGRRPDPADPASHRTSGMPELCKVEAPGIASGWRVYDGLGRVAKEYFPQPIPLPAGGDNVDAVVTQLHSRGDWAGVVLADSHAEFIYDAMGRVTEVTQPDENKISFAFETVSPENGEIPGVPPAAYIPARVRATVVDARCAIRQFDRDARGLIAAVSEALDVPGGVRIPGDLDEQGMRIRERTDCDSALAPARLARTSYGYDMLGQLIELRRPEGADIIAAEYDLFGRRVRIADPDRGDEALTFDPLGNIVGRDRISFRAVSPRKIRYLFDADRMTGIRYDSAFSHLDVDYAYDQFPADWSAWASGSVSTKEWLEGFAEEACRNCIGQVVAVRDASGLSVHGFDVYGQATDTLRSIRYDGQEIGRFELRNDYDTWGTLRAEHIQDLKPEVPDPKCINPRRPDDYLCDFEHEIFYSYDQAGKAIGVTLDNRDMARVGYDEFNATVAKWTGDGTITDLTYSGVDRRLEKMSVALFDGAPVINARYAYDAGGNLSQYVNEAGTYKSKFAFGYDGGNRLIAANGNAADPAAKLPNQLTAASPVSLAEGYCYDQRHRITRKGNMPVGTLAEAWCDSPAGAGDMVYSYPAFDHSSGWKPVDAPDSITSDGTASYDYDGWGSLEAVVDVPNDTPRDGRSEVRRLSWDPESRLTNVQITNEENGVLTFNDYVYDFQGMRVVKRAGQIAGIPGKGNVTNDEGWKQLSVSPSFARRYDGPAFIQISLGSQRVASVTLNNTAQKSDRTTIYYHSELPNGSTTAITRQVLGGEHQGQLYSRVVYSPYGDVLASLAYSKLDTDISGVPNYTFAGKETDADTGYSYFGARYYDPATAVWLSPDPAVGAFMSTGSPWLWEPGSLASFSYVGGDPINRIDTNGMWWSETQWLGAARMVGGGFEAASGAAFGAATSWTGAGAVVGGAVALHGADQFVAGARQVWNDQRVDTATSQIMQAGGVSASTANAVDDGISVVGSIYTGVGTTAIKLAHVRASDPLAKGMSLFEVFWRYESGSRALSNSAFEAVGGIGTSPIEKSFLLNGVGINIFKGAQLANTGLTPAGYSVMGLLGAGGKIYSSDDDGSCCVMRQP